MKTKKIRRKIRVRKQWTDYIVPLECECGRKYNLTFSLCQPGKTLLMHNQKTILRKPFLDEVDIGD